MKKIIKKLLTKDWFWWPVKISLGSANYLFTRLQDVRHCELAAPQRLAKARRKEEVNRNINKTLIQTDGIVVRNGPFKGMRYPEKRAFGSSFYPKILGSYEKELDAVISYIVRQPYTAVVGIGCAEGYYTVGLGMHIKSASVYAFDINKEALSFCRKMATLNGVTLKTGGFCDESKLLKLKLGKRALIFMDCEGYELNLVSNKVTGKLKQHDFLIESHDFLQIDTTQRLLETLTTTHICEVIESIDDILKAYTYQYEELEQLTLSEKHKVLREARPGIMRWVFAKSKNPTS